MANYLASTYIPNAPRTDENFSIWAQVAQMKQQKYDSAKSQIQSTLDAFGGISLLRDEDNQYLANKITDVTNKLNSSANRDLSQADVADDLLYTAKSVAQDENVLNAIEQTQKFKSFQAQVAQIREKKPELYSDTNYSYALDRAGYNDYMSGKSNKIGSIQYSNYVDVTANSLKKIKDLKDLRGKRVIETPDPQNPGQTLKRTIEGLTDQEIFDNIPGILTPEESQQLNINGWSKYGGNLKLAQQNFTAYKTQLLSNIDENVENNQAIINNSAATKEQKQTAQLAIEAYKREKEQTNNELASINTEDGASLGGFLERNSWKRGIATAAKSEWNSEYEKDDYWFAKQNLELDLAKEDRQKIMFGLDANKKQLETLKLQKELGVDANGNPLTSANAVSFSAKEAALAEEINPYTDQEKEFGEVTTQMSGLINQAINSERTTKDIKDHYTAELRKRGYDINGNVLAGKEGIAANYPKALAMKQAFDASNAATIHGDVAKTLAGIELKRDSLSSEVSTAKVGGLTEAFKQSPDRYIATYRSLLNEALTDSQSDLEEGTAEEIYSIAQEAQSFIQDNGGFDSLKNTLQKSPEKLAQFADKLDKLYNKPSTITGSGFRFIQSIVDPVYTGERAAMKNLKQDAAVVSNNILRQRTAQNRNVSFNTAQIATIGDKTLRQRVVNMLPQTEDTPLFDPNNPISFEKTPQGDLKITQNKGYTAGNKQSRLRGAEVTVSRDDAAYNELLRYVDINDRQRGLDAERTSVRVKPTIAADYIDNTKKTILSKADNNIQNLAPSVQGAFITNPSWFLTQPRTEEAYNKVLKNKITPEKITQVVSLMAANPEKLKPELKPFDGNWALSVSTSTGKVLNEGDTGIKYLDDDWAYLMKTYPQVITSEGVLRYLSENPKEIDSLIKILQN